MYFEKDKWWRPDPNTAPPLIDPRVLIKPVEIPIAESHGYTIDKRTPFNDGGDKSPSGYFIHRSHYLHSDGVWRPSMRPFESGYMQDMETVRLTLRNELVREGWMFREFGDGEGI